jgi:hypothetical protein
VDDDEISGSQRTYKTDENAAEATNTMHPDMFKYEIYGYKIEFRQVNTYIGRKRHSVSKRLKSALKGRRFQGTEDIKKM